MLKLEKKILHVLLMNHKMKYMKLKSPAKITKSKLRRRVNYSNLWMI